MSSPRMRFRSCRGRPAAGNRVTRAVRAVGAVSVVAAVAGFAFMAQRNVSAQMGAAPVPIERGSPQDFGPYHPSTLVTVGDLARVSTATGDISAAIGYQRRADSIIEKQLELNLSVGSERQKELFVRSVADWTDRTISLHLDRARDHADAATLAATVLLQRKGRVLDAMLDTFALVRGRTTNPREQALLNDLKASTARLAELSLRGSSRESPEARRDGMQTCERVVDQLEDELAATSADFRAQFAPVTLDAVQAALPADAALVEFALYRRFDPAADNGDAYSAPRYAVYLVRRTGVPLGLDLGDSAAIDEEVRRFLDELRDPRTSGYKRAGRDLFDRLLRPLVFASAGASRLLIAPDGNLNLVPYEALVDENQHYLLERFSISYLTSGRDLLRMGTQPSPAGPPVVVAAPAFGEPPSAAADAFYFPPLPGSAAEARAIKSLFPSATVLTGSRATKTALLHVQAPSILHVASHGFFVSGGAALLENPLLRSGIALAGANLRDRVYDAGILTALEASNLNLWGTKLVTLSACDTGVGEIRSGEGVYGLRRAFVLAGAESLVMSLWPVSDSVARETMVAFYRGLAGHGGRGDALHQAKLALLRTPGREHPFYWASFIQSGDWTSL